MATPKKSRARLAKRIVLGVLLGIVALVVLVVGTVFAVGSSHWGKQKILAIALPAVENILVGKLRIGALDGSLTHMLILREVELTDLEGQRVLHVPYLGVRYNLLALVGKTLHVTAVELKGAEVHVRVLKDGRLNVATLVKPDDSPPSTGPLPLRIVVSGINAEIAARFDGKKDLGNLAHAAAGITLRGGIQLKRDRNFSVDVDGLNVRASAPLGAELGLRGGMAFGLADVLHTLQVKGVALSVRTDGSELSRLAPAAALRGPLAVDASVDGPLSRLVAQLKLKLPRGDGQLDATVNVADPKLPWELALTLNGLDPQSLRANLPASRIDLRMHGTGVGPSGRVEIAQLQAQVGKNSVRLHGSAEVPLSPAVTKDPLAAQADLTLELDARDLSELAKLGAPPLKGSLSGTVRLGLMKRSLRAGLNLRGDDLRGFDARIARLQLDLETTDLRGKLRLATERVIVGGQLLSRVVLNVAGDRRKVQLNLEGDGPQAVKLKLALAAMPQLVGGHGLLDLEDNELTGAVVDLTELTVRRGTEQLALTRPTQARLLELKTDPVIELDPLSLKLGALTLRVGGRFETKGQRMRAAVDANHIDLQQLARVATGRSDVPKSQLALHANVSGTVAAPQGQARLSGSIEPMGTTLPWRVTPALNASFAQRRVRGDFSLRTQAKSPDGPTPAVTLRFNAPLSDALPIDIKLDATTGFKALRKLLPPTAQTLDGTVTVQATLTGTLRRPQATVRVALPKWELPPVRGQDTLLTVSYLQEKLSAQLASRFESTEGKPLGKVRLDAATPVHLSSKVNVAALIRELRSAPSSLTLALQELALPQILIVADPSSQLPLVAGNAEVAVQLRGPVDHPTATVRIDANGVRTAPGSQILDAPLGAGVRLSYQQDQLGVTVDLSLDGKPVLRGKAGTTVRVADLLADSKATVQKLPLRAEVDILPTQLPKGVLVQGTVRAHAELSGTPASPQVKAAATATALQLGTWAVGEVDFHASADPHRALKAHATIAQKPGQYGGGGAAGSLSLDADVPLPVDLDNAATQVVLRAQKFRIDYQAPRGVSSALGVARGSLNADFSVKGGRPRPVIAGGVRFDDGQLSTAALPQLIRDIVLDVQAREDGMISLKEISAKIDQGRALVRGNVQIVGGELKHIWLAATTQEMPIAAGPIGLWLNTNVKVEGGMEKETLKIKVSIPNGSLRLPKLTSVSSSDIQPVGPLEDIRFIDATARRLAAAAEAEAKEKEEEAKKFAADKNKKPMFLLPRRTEVSVELPGNFSVTGPEVHTEVGGHVEAKIAATQKAGPVITGEIRTIGGWLELMSRRYQIDRVVVSLSGATPPNPTFDISISRKLEAATIYVHVGGTAKKPKLSFRSEPPIYDQAQMLAIVISGSDGKRSGTLQQQALGALSGLLIGQMKEKLGRAIPIDVIKFDLGNTDRSGATYSSMEVGKYLRDNLYLSYVHRFGTPSTILRRQNNDQISLEYYFRRSYQLNLMGGDQGVGALNLYWTKRF